MGAVAGIWFAKTHAVILNHFLAKISNSKTMSFYNFSLKNIFVIDDFGFELCLKKIRQNLFTALPRTLLLIDLLTETKTCIKYQS